MRKSIILAFLAVLLLFVMAIVAAVLGWSTSAFIFNNLAILLSFFTIIFVIRTYAIREWRLITQNQQDAKLMSDRVSKSIARFRKQLARSEKGTVAQEAILRDYQEKFNTLERRLNDLAIDLKFRVHQVAPADPNKIASGNYARSLPKMHKVLVINFDETLQTIINSNHPVVFDEEFFASDLWPDRPNSTQRLNLANYQAFLQLPSDISVEIMFHLDLPSEASRLFDKYNVVIILQAPNSKSKATILKILTELQHRPTKARVVFGTEMTWFKELDQGHFTNDHIREIYTQHTLLRHTARTDIRAYSNSDFDNSTIQEFELGLDTEVVAPKTSISERDHILFVKAPEGRSTKNNEAIYEIRRKIEEDLTLNHLNITVLAPPYSTTEYWDLLQRTRYLIFTSNGETFSYVLNDAKAAGTIAFFPDHMYENRSGNVIVDNYPGMPGRYMDVDDLLAQLRELETDSSFRAAHSKLGREYVEELFSLQSLTQNWSKIIRDESLNRHAILLLDTATAQTEMSLAKIAQTAIEHKCQYVLPYLNRLVNLPSEPRLRRGLQAKGIALVRDCFHLKGTSLYYRESTGPQRANGPKKLESTHIPKAELLKFWRILIRVNKLSRVVTNLPANHEVVQLLQQLTYRENSKFPYNNVVIEHI